MATECLILAALCPDTLKLARYPVSFPPGAVIRPAQKADLHPACVDRVERGERSASIQTLARMAKALEMKLRDRRGSNC